MFATSVEMASSYFDYLFLTAVFFSLGLGACDSPSRSLHCEGSVVTRVRKHNAHLMNEQGQCKDAVRTLNQELKEVREKLGEAGHQNDKLDRKSVV